MKICKYCNKEIDDKHSIYANHVRWCDKNTSNGDKGSNKISQAAYDRYKIIYPIIEFKVNCRICNSEVIFLERESDFKKRKEKYFCSKKCSLKRSHCLFNRELISNNMKKKWQDPEYAILAMGRLRKFTSKGEEEVKKYFKDNYPNDEWTFGGPIKYDDILLTRDLYSNKLKVSIEYDGIWHFKDIHGQLEEKQIKDNKLEKWTVDNDWRLIRIKDELFIKNKDLYLKKLIDCVYNKSDQIIKIY